jgi:hypothetical protein
VDFPELNFCSIVLPIHISQQQLSRGMSNSPYG